MPAFILTDHALERFIERHAPHNSKKEIEAWFHKYGHKAQLLPYCAADGKRLWRLARYTFVTRPGRHPDTEVVVTIYPCR